MHPLLILAIGIVTIILLIVVFRVHAFVALIVSAILVSVLSPGPWSEKIMRVAFEFGNSAGKIGIVIALASVIGTCMMESGAADRIVRAFVSLLGQKRVPLALMGSGYVLAMPVFFDTVFYLLVPLARSLYHRTRKNYLLYLLAIAAGGATTHTLVPPTPGPLVLATQLNVNLGLMIVMGMAVGVPVALAGFTFALFVNRVMPIEMREAPGTPVTDGIPDSRLPPLGLSLLPIVLPVFLITANTVVDALGKEEVAAWKAGQGAILGGPGSALAQPPDSLVVHTLMPAASLIGDANLALLLSALTAIYLFRRQRRPTRSQTAAMVENSLMSGGVIILITAAGGAFGAMLKAAQIGPSIEDQFQSSAVSGLMYLLLGFSLSAVLKIAQGSSTVAMITASGMLAAMLESGANLGFHPVYLGLAIGSGSLIGSWMNDSGFWIVARMGGLTEVETLKSWTPLLCVLGITGLIATAILALLLPLTTE